MPRRKIRTLARDSALLQELTAALTSEIDSKRTFKVHGDLQSFKSLPLSGPLPASAEAGLGSAHTLLQLDCGEVTLKTPETAIHLHRLQCSAVEHERTQRRRPPPRRQRSASWKLADLPAPRKVAQTEHR